MGKEIEVTSGTTVALKAVKQILLNLLLIYIYNVLLEEQPLRWVARQRKMRLCLLGPTVEKKLKHSTYCNNDWMKN